MEQLDFSESPSVDELVTILGVSRDTAFKISGKIIRSMRDVRKLLSREEANLEKEWNNSVNFKYYESESEVTGVCHESERIDWGKMMT